MSIIEGAVELIGEMQQKIAAKELELSEKQWLELHENLNEARNQLRADAELKDVATLVVNAFKEHRHLKRVFADKLQRLTGGTKLTGIKPSIPKRRRKVGRNKKVILDTTDPQHKKVIVQFIGQVEEEAKKAGQSARKTRRRSWLPWNR